VASIYESEFKKLIDIYLDCVFDPELRLETFLHEGWHYENKKNNLSHVNGVVYSEMQSAFSNPIRETRDFLHKKLFPESIYRFESAGVPEEILKLTHQELLDFHKKYYCAENSYIYLYGDIKEFDYYLETIDLYLRAHNLNSKNNFEIIKQNKFSKPVLASRLYNFSSAKKNFYGSGFVIGDAFDLVLILSFEILNSYLTKTAGAPLKKFLPLAKTYYEYEMLEPVYFVLSENFNGSLDRFYSNVIKIFENIYSQGLNKVLLESCINNLEFELRTSSHKFRPKGLVLNLNILTD
jgi:Zn-dependent M16 (insulinase) family peptidase